MCEKVEVPDDTETACIICWMTGRYFREVLSSDDRSNLLSRIRETSGVVSADVAHVGENRFTLLVIFEDGRLVTPCAAFVADTGLVNEEEDKIGMAAVVAMIPPVGTPWMLVISRQGEDGYDEPTVLPEPYDDDELVAAIAEIAP